MGSFVVILEDRATNEHVKTEFSLSSVRRGMVMLSEAPQHKPSSSLSGSVCWSFGVRGLTWLPSGRLPGMCNSYLPSTNATIVVYSGNVCQHAKVTEVKEANNSFINQLDSSACIDTSVSPSFSLCTCFVVYPLLSILRLAVCWKKFQLLLEAKISYSFD